MALKFTCTFSSSSEQQFEETRPVLSPSRSRASRPLLPIIWDQADVLRAAVGLAQPSALHSPSSPAHLPPVMTGRWCCSQEKPPALKAECWDLPALPMEGMASLRCRSQGSTGIHPVHQRPDSQAALKRHVEGAWQLWAKAARFIVPVRFAFFFPLSELLLPGIIMRALIGGK